MRSNSGVEVDGDQRIYFYTRDEVLTYIKSFLQPYYECGLLSREYFVFVAKQTLLFVMSAGSMGTPRYSKAFIEKTLQLQLPHLKETRPPFADSARFSRGDSIREKKDKSASAEALVRSRPATPNAQREPHGHLCGDEKEYLSDMSRGSIRRAAAKGAERFIAPHRLQSARRRRNASPVAEKTNNGKEPSHDNNNNNDDYYYYYSTPFARHPVPESHTPPHLSFGCAENARETPPLQLHPYRKQTQQQQEEEEITPLIELSFDRTQRRIAMTRAAGAQTPNTNTNANSPPRSNVLDENSATEPAQNGALLSLVRQLRTRVVNIRADRYPSPPQSSSSSSYHQIIKKKSETQPIARVVSADDGINHTPLASETNDSSAVAARRPGECEVSAIVQLCLARFAARRELFDEWSFGRQELLRREESAFTALLLSLQQRMIHKLAQRMRGEREEEEGEGEGRRTKKITETKGGERMGWESPPLPLTPPPKTQFVSDEAEEHLENISAREDHRGKAKGNSYLNLFRGGSAALREIDFPSPELSRRSASTPARRTADLSTAQHLNHMNNSISPNNSSHNNSSHDNSRHTVMVPRSHSRDSFVSANRRVYRLRSPTTAARRVSSAEAFALDKQRRKEEEEIKREEETKREARKGKEERAMVVEFLRELLQPAFNSGAIRADRLAEIVQRATRGLSVSPKKKDKEKDKDKRDGVWERGKATGWRQKLRRRVEMLLDEARFAN